MKTIPLARYVLAALLGLVVSNRVFAADLTAAQQAAIKQGVLQMLHGMLAAEERLDADAVWSVHADVPGYWWADTDGKLYDFAGTKKSWADYYVPCAKLKFTTQQEEVLVLGPDLAYYLWHGRADITGKDGTVSWVDPWTARYLCRRIGGVWKIVGGQDSSLPPQPVPPAAQQASSSSAPAAAGVASAPAQPERRIRLADAPADRRLSYTTWRTDYYICTGIAYAKSLGHSVEDFAAYVASQHEMGTTSADGLTKIAQLLYFGLTNYPKGQVVVTAESDTAITMQFNRAYAAYFKKGPVLGVTMDEFERCFWGHLEILAKRKGFGFDYRIEGGNVTFTISLAK
jgi:hypothetical protein